jgi:hypothetical protein
MNSATIIPYIGGGGGGGGREFKLRTTFSGVFELHFKVTV